MKKFLAALFFLALTGAIIYRIISPRDSGPEPDIEKTQVYFPTSTQIPQQEKQRIQQELRSAFYEVPDTENATINRIAVSGTYALVSWTEEDAGAMLVFKLVNSDWVLLEADGGGYSVEALVDLGVPQASAVELVTTISQ